jgi:hypothetical protein
VWKTTPCGADGRLKVFLTVFSPPREAGRAALFAVVPWVVPFSLTSCRLNDGRYANGHISGEVYLVRSRV